MPTKLITNVEKRVDMVTDLAEKSEMNYRLLAMKIMEKWQSSIKNEKEFLKNLRQYKTVSFTVKKDGSIEIKGVEGTFQTTKRQVIEREKNWKKIARSR